MSFSKKERFVLLLALGVMGLCFVFPLWNIQLWAPQYPEGLSMQIWINRITGNVDQINLLNHYIGMKHITPESIPELTIMPIVVGVMLTTGVVIALLGSRAMCGAWFIVMAVAGLAGLFDFWSWTYDYGHNLSPTAPIKIPGMTYSPPIFGYKQLLNIEASSFPHIGGWAIAVSMSVVLAVIFSRHLTSLGTRLGRAGLSVLCAALLPLILSCKVSPSPLQPGVDSCDTCRMTITDTRFGGEAITDKGRVYKFDSISCLVKFVGQQKEPPRQVLVSDYLSSGKLVDVHDAHIAKASSIRTPMADHMIASTDEHGLKSLGVGTDMEFLKWNALLGPTPH